MVLQVQGANLHDRLDIAGDMRSSALTALLLYCGDWAYQHSCMALQVHGGNLHDGRRFAMKIQYPGVARSIESDVDNLMRLINIANLLPKGLYVEQAAEVSISAGGQHDNNNGNYSNNDIMIPPQDLSKNNMAKVGFQRQAWWCSQSSYKTHILELFTYQMFVENVNFGRQWCHMAFAHHKFVGTGTEPTAHYLWVAKLHVRPILIWAVRWTVSRHM